MISTTKPLVAAALSLAALALMPGAATAQAPLSYSGSWPVTAALPPHFGNTACLTLVDNGTAGSTHSGPVTASGDLTGNLSGTFQIVGHILVVNIQSGSSTGQVVFSQFIAPASDGELANGVYNHAGLFPAASYALTVGAKGGC